MRVVQRHPYRRLELDDGVLDWPAHVVGVDLAAQWDVDGAIGRADGTDMSGGHRCRQASLLGADGLKRMPPASDGEALKPAQIELIRKWIDQGAAAPKAEQAESDPKDHWAFKKPVRPAVPAAGVRSTASTGTARTTRSRS